MNKLLLISALMVGMVGPARAADPKESAVDAAKQYTVLMKGDQPIKAIETFWEFPEMFQIMFGEDLKKHSAAEQEEMKKLFLGLLRKVYANPQIAELMKNATFEGFESKPPKDGKTVVTFTAKIGENTLPNTLVFKPVEGKWRVVDAAANNQPLMGEAMGRAYKAQAGKVTPLEFIKEMTQGAQ